MKNIEIISIKNGEKNDWLKYQRIELISNENQMTRFSTIISLGISPQIKIVGGNCRLQNL